MLGGKSFVNCQLHYLSQIIPQLANNETLDLNSVGHVYYDPEWPRLQILNHLMVLHAYREFCWLQEI